ncbi:hypothetical protein CDL15_Pgr020030 [Punica granatum]|uniref:FAR1 domain-containing protein n=1 Tax=Punica granatum TaxID=22663 RepID=A0A218VQW6_PUNGR|nr:hypothetical protein CDL15_Pgr020030 [Punica granatum]
MHHQVVPELIAEISGTGTVSAVRLRSRSLDAIKFLPRLNAESKCLSFDWPSLVSVDLNEEAMETVAEEQKIEPGEGDVWEPCVGMVFESEDAARKFYTEYARRAGFAVRVLDRQRSSTDGRTLSLRLGCNKEGFKRPGRRGSDGVENKKRNRGASFREGCNAAILVKRERAEKRGVEMWMVARFVKEHCHPLLASTNGFSTTPVVSFVSMPLISVSSCLLLDFGNCLSAAFILRNS